MSSITKIALYEPGRQAEGKYFTFRLKRTLNNEDAVFTPQGKTIVVAPVNFSFHAFQRFLLYAGVINKKRKWNFGDGHLIILGDCFTIPECLWLIYGLEEKALKNGGYVHYILGKREVVNMNGKWQYQQPAYAITGEANKGGYAVLYDGNQELNRWFHTKNVIEKVGSALISHMGIPGEINNLGLSIKMINDMVRSVNSKNGSTYGDALLNVMLKGTGVKGLSPEIAGDSYANEEEEKVIDQTLQLFETDTLITALPDLKRVSSHYNSRLINVCTNFEGDCQDFLVIHKGHYYHFDTKGRKELIK